jgi:hypothetical protein
LIKYQWPSSSLTNFCLIPSPSRSRAALVMRQASRSHRNPHKSLARQLQQSGYSHYSGYRIAGTVGRLRAPL